MGLIPGLEDPLEKEMATSSSILTWKIPWTEDPCRLQFRKSRTQQSTHTHTGVIKVTETLSFITFCCYLKL